MSAPGRVCPVRYRYGTTALARVPARPATTLYVVGGLYGNLPALDAVEALAAAEQGPVVVVFNGDFNWFNVDTAGFAEVNRRVLRHDATLGNVEAELGADDSAAGCGCAYPAAVESGIVERSNRIHARLKAAARAHPEILARLEGLPMLARYRIGDVEVGVVHGDAESLAGWRFDAAALDEHDNRAWIESAFAAARVEVFASTHTGTAALRCFPGGVIVNNGAAGMPNFRARRHGMLTRIGLAPGPHESLYGARVRGTRIDALAVNYDDEAWRRTFLLNWAPGSDAHVAYYDRLVNGPAPSLPRHAAEVVGLVSGRGLLQAPIMERRR